MAAANSNIQLTDLDFNSLKSNFTTYLKSQNTFKDYNFEGSGMSILLDVLAYNTQYNAYYLNMVANEMFLDSAIQRSSVISHTKVLNYTPKSAIAPTAEVNIVVNNVTTPLLTLPAYLTFLSSPVNGINYNFVNYDTQTVNTVGNTVTFNNVKIKQGVVGNFLTVVDSVANPSYTFEIPDATVDTTTLKVTVQQSSQNTSYDIYHLTDNHLTLTGESMVYFLQESLKGTYEIYFGDGILGKKLSDGNIVNLSYLSTEGTAAAGANSFVLMNTIGGFAASAVQSVTQATQGGDKESLSSIKFQAPKAFAAQGRAVSKNDYISAIQQNTLGFSFDAVNVWGGEQNVPPVYGQVFVCLKPTGGYDLTTSQKQQIVNEVIKPISVMTVTPTIVDPDYTYLQLTVNVYYNPYQTNLTSDQIKASVITSIQNFAKTTLNTFNSTFNAYELLSAVQNTNKSITTSEYSIRLQKKFYPNLTTPTTYQLNYNSPLEKGVFLSGVSSSPDLQYRDPENLTNIIPGIYIEEVPSETFGVDTVSVINPGFGYQSVPKITIAGDGSGATAHAIVVNGRVDNIVVDNSGNNYTFAVATITPQPGDTTGRLAAATVELQGRFGTLRSYYFKNTVDGQIKTIFDSNIGTVDYSKGIVTLNSFSPNNVNNPLGQLTVSSTPTTSIISSTYDGIITVDPYDPNAIIVNVIAKSS
jgi:hypothetical protein